MLAAQVQGIVQPLHLLPSHAVSAHDPLANPQENAIAMAREKVRCGYFSGPGWAPLWHEAEHQQTTGSIKDGGRPPLCWWRDSNGAEPAATSTPLAARRA